MKILGIEDPAIWSVYLLCIISALYAVYYGVKNWNNGEEQIFPEDVTWVKDEKKVEEDL